MSFLPSVSYIAQALYDHAGKGIDWELAEPEDQKAYLDIARRVLLAVEKWQAQQQLVPKRRYGYEASADGWIIFDTIVGRSTVLGTIHDPILAQQVIDELNNMDAKKMPSKQTADE